MPPRRRHNYPRRRRYPWWLKELVITWREQGLTSREIRARLVEMGFNISIATIAAWLYRPFIGSTNR